VGDDATALTDCSGAVRCGEEDDMSPRTINYSGAIGIVGTTAQRELRPIRTCMGRPSDRSELDELRREDARARAHHTRSQILSRAPSRQNPLRRRRRRFLSGEACLCVPTRFALYARCLLHP
jgi:hypothetical protein